MWWFQECEITEGDRTFLITQAIILDNQILNKGATAGAALGPSGSKGAAGQRCPILGQAVLSLWKTI